MKKTFFFFLAFASILAFQACNEDKVKDVQKNGSIETSLQVDHLNDSLDVMITTNKIWVHNVLVKTVNRRDTLPSLGVAPEEAENDNGDTKNVLLRKDYEIYITVK